MAPSVLGKRARTIESLHDTSVSSRVKRRLPFSTVNDENIDPAATQELDIEDATIIQLPTPTTPRHRDALSKRVPVTPRHRLGRVSKPLTPRTPRTPTTSLSVKTVYESARRLFSRSTDPGRLIGRDTERHELRSFIEQGVRSKSGRCIYVSGPPGTGKSALVSETCRDLQHNAEIKIAYVNCMGIKSAKDLHGKLLEELCGSSEVPVEAADKQLQALFLPKNKENSNLTFIVSLDEIDHLLTFDLEILYRMFEWALHRSSRLIMIGIANALDLTDRFLPRLKARNLKPHLLPFLPYTAPQITAVVTTKLKTLVSNDDQSQPDHIPFLHPAAIQLCAKKVASQTGDLRKAFDIIRRTIDMVETETKQNLQRTFSCPDSPSKTPLAENFNSASPSRTKFDLTASLAALKPATAPRATIAHMSRVSAAAFSQGTTQRLRLLNLQQKAGICTLVSYGLARKELGPCERPKTTSDAPTIRQLYHIYCALCKRENALHPLTATEFVDVMGGLETLGLVGEESGTKFLGMRSTPSKKSRGEQRRIVSFVDEKEIEECLNGVGGDILKGLLSGDC